MEVLYDEDKITEIYNRNIDDIYRLSYFYMKNKHDAEDISQTVFMKFLKTKPIFNDLKHEKSWFVLVTSNLCKNNLKHWWNTILEFKDNIGSSTKKDETIEVLLKLPSKYKVSLYMYYYLGYTTKEIAKSLEMNESTVRSNLKRGRDILKDMLRKE